MTSERIDDHGAWKAVDRGLDSRTLVFDRARNQPVLWLQGVLVLPVGALIELTDPDAQAYVVGVRLLAGKPMTLCLDVEVPHRYWYPDQPDVAPA